MPHWLTTVTALEWLVIGIVGVFLVDVVWRAGVLVVDRARSAVDDMAERASESIASGAAHFVKLLKGLVWIALTWAFSPVGKAYNALTEWVLSKLETPEEPREESWSDLVKESDPVTEARDVLGLAKGFTKADLDSQFRKLIRSFHTDVSGSNWLASKINVARDTLLKSKGWK